MHNKRALHKRRSIRVEEVAVSLVFATDIWGQPLSHHVVVNYGLAHQLTIQQEAYTLIKCIYLHPHYCISKVHSSYASSPPPSRFRPLFVFPSVFHFTCMVLERYRIRRSADCAVLVLVSNPQSKCVIFKVENFEGDVGETFRNGFVEV